MNVSSVSNNYPYDYSINTSLTNTGNNTQSDFANILNTNLNGTDKTSSTQSKKVDTNYLQTLLLQLQQNNMNLLNNLGNASDSDSTDNDNIDDIFGIGQNSTSQDDITNLINNIEGNSTQSNDTIENLLNSSDNSNLAQILSGLNNNSSYINNAINAYNNVGLA